MFHLPTPSQANNREPLAKRPINITLQLLKVASTPTKPWKPFTRVPSINTLHLHRHIKNLCRFNSLRLGMCGHSPRVFNIRHVKIGRLMCCTWPEYPIRYTT